jgi:hypothetical protein
MILIGGIQRRKFEPRGSFEMRIHRLGVAIALTMVISFSAKASAQSKPPAKAPATATSDQVRDLSGVWFDDRPRPVTTNERYWIFKFNAEEPPMTAWGQAQYDATKSSFGTRAYPLAETNDPLYHTCTPPGLPRVYLHPFPIQIVQTPGEVIVLFEYDSIRHQIFTDGRPHDTALGPLWMGDSIGHWEGDTLVADTVNFNDKTWLDRIGHPHSDALHVVERFRRKDHEHLDLDITIEDPKAYTKPWTTHIEFGLRPKWTLQEQFCEDEESFQTLDKNAAAPAK